MGRYSRANSPRTVLSKNGSRSSSIGPYASDSEESELLNGINFGNIDEMITERLALFMRYLDEPTKSSQKYPMHSVRGLTDMLLDNRSVIPASDREMLLNQLYTLNVKNNEGSFEDMVSLFKTSKGYDQMVSVRNVTATAISHCDEVAEEAIEFLKVLEDKISHPDIDSASREQFIYAYSSIALVVYEGSGSYGIDARIDFLLEAVLGLIPDCETNARVVGSLIYGIGALLTLLGRGDNVNEMLENITACTAELLDSNAIEITKPTAMLFAFAYETYEYVDDLDDDSQPYTNTYQVTKRLHEIIASPETSQSRKKKYEGRTVIRAALETIEQFSDPLTRLQLYETMKSTRTADVLTHIRLSKTRSLSIRSWNAFFRAVLMKWTFGVGLQTQLAVNRTLYAMLSYMLPLEYKARSGEFRVSEKVVRTDEDDAREKRKRSDKVDKKKIERDRMEKLERQLEQTGLGYQ